VEDAYSSISKLQKVCQPQPFDATTGGTWVLKEEFVGGNCQYAAPVKRTYYSVQNYCIEQLVGNTREAYTCVAGQPQKKNCGTGSGPCTTCTATNLNTACTSLGSNNYVKYSCVTPADATTKDPSTTNPTKTESSFSIKLVLDIGLIFVLFFMF